MEIHVYIFPISRGPPPPEIWPTFKRFSCADEKICIAFSDLQLKLPHLFLGLFHLLLGRGAGVSFISGILAKENI